MWNRFGVRDNILHMRFQFKDVAQVADLFMKTKKDELRF